MACWLTSFIWQGCGPTNVAKNQSLTKAFIWVYIPVLLLLPDYFIAITPGLPDPSFNQTASVALFAVFYAQGMPGIPL